MTLEQLLEAVLKDGAWVPVETYLAYYKGETAEAVRSRRAKGIWRDGVESKFVKGGGLWVNVLAVNRWAAKRELRLVSRRDTTKRGEGPASASNSRSAAYPAAND